MVALAAIIVFVSDPLAEWLIFQRENIVAGEIWRLFTGNWVHFSARHVVLDVAALALAGAIAERRGFPGLTAFYLLSPWAIGLTVLIGCQEMTTYGGLSGMATGTIVFLALFGLPEPGHWRWAYALLLLLIAGKIGLEASSGQALFLTPSNHSTVIAWQSHLAGSLIAVVMFVFAACRTRLETWCESVWCNFPKP